MATVMAMPVSPALATAVAAICFAPRWVRRLPAATYIDEPCVECGMGAGTCTNGGVPSRRRACAHPAPDDLGPFPRVTLDSALKSLILRMISSRHRQFLEDHASGYLIWSPFRGLTGTGPRTA